MIIQEHYSVRATLCIGIDETLVSRTKSGFGSDYGIDGALLADGDCLRILHYYVLYLHMPQVHRHNMRTHKIGCPLATNAPLPSETHGRHVVELEVCFRLLQLRNTVTS